MEEKHNWDKVNSWSEELDILKSIINKTELIETIKWGGPIYVHNGKNVLGLAGFKNYFAIWFHNGVFLKDEHKVLLNAQEGVTKAMRQWRFQSRQDINEPLLLAYIKEAIQNTDEGKVMKPVKKTLEIPDFFTALLADGTISQADFDKFSPYKQKEFIAYLETAKRVETRQSRLQKIIPMISGGIGLNDKFRK